MNIWRGFWHFVFLNCCVSANFKLCQQDSSHRDRFWPNITAAAFRSLQNWFWRLLQFALTAGPNPLAFCCIFKEPVKCLCTETLVVMLLQLGAADHKEFSRLAMCHVICTQVTDEVPIIQTWKTCFWQKYWKCFIWKKKKNVSEREGIRVDMFSL